MRITCTTFEEYLECLDAESNLYQNSVHFSIVKKPPEKDKVKEEVHVVLTAVAEKEDGSEYFIDLIRFCGFDRPAPEGEAEGSFIAGKIREELIAYCEKRDWKVRPGILGE